MTDMFQLHPTGLDGVHEIRPRIAHDERGIFVKTVQRTTFAQLGMRTDFAEEYHTVSQAGVLRGMHFQLPPHEYAKLVYCVTGRVLDVILEMRRNRAHYGTAVSLELSAEKANMIYIPPGCAHGFCVLDAPATLVYRVTTEYDPGSDAAIRWNSFGFAWPTTSPVISARDAAALTLHEFASFFGP